MALIRQRVTQSGADTLTVVQLPLLALDGKSGYEFLALEAYWVNGQTPAAADMIVNAKLATASTSFNFNDDEIIAQVDWGVQNTAGVAVAFAFEPQKRLELIEARVSVQPAIYVQVQSAGSGQANMIDFRIYYNTIKMTELEYLRMYTGGA